MALQSPSPQKGVPRSDVGQVADAMLMDDRVKWLAVVFEQKGPVEDEFTVTPYVADPTVT